ncbi:Serine carboxypeptidase 1 [Rhynchospora pubera]|uniref:Serine carboxypeptidase 1 n=1 Tax=Rhynchospora pubera TaxID=906938 RepID=A0AAV8FFD3_9POAL|nr:Serine carboxypeptidase 1 [Rhynchospora pubera]
MALISDELFESTKKSCSGEYANPTNSHCAKYLDVVDEVTKDINGENILEPYCRTDSPRPGEIHSSTIGKGLYYEEVPLLISGLPSDCRASAYVLPGMWANNDTVQDALGIRKGTVDVWKRCRHDLPYTHDIQSTVPYHFNVTNKGFAALIYSGDHDMLGAGHTAPEYKPKECLAMITRWLSGAPL